MTVSVVPVDCLFVQKKGSQQMCVADCRDVLSVDSISSACCRMLTRKRGLDVRMLIPHSHHSRTVQRTCPADGWRSCFSAPDTKNGNGHIVCCHFCRAYDTDPECHPAEEGRQTVLTPRNITYAASSGDDLNIRNEDMKMKPDYKNWMSKDMVYSFLKKQNTLKCACAATEA